MNKEELKIIQLLSCLDDEGKAELLKYGAYLMYCAKHSEDDELSSEDDWLDDGGSFLGRIFRASEGRSVRKIEPNEWWLQACEYTEKIENSLDLFQEKKIGKINGKKIKWIVLDKDETGRKLLLLSRYSVDARRFDESMHFVDWERSSIRKWLNDDFYGEVFVNVPRVGIIVTKLEDTGTEDKVFLLSADEVNRYLNSTECIYGNPNERYVDSVCAWWLRSNSKSAENTDIVKCNGVIDSSKDYGTNIGIRPAMWIDMDALGWK